ncbi:MAG: pseudouridine synthase [Lentisphaeria bacterium]
MSFPLNNVEPQMRLAKFMAKCGIASRRKSEQLITAGHVRINGRPETSPAVNIDVNRDTVEFDGHPVNLNSPEYYALNKPRGYTCSAKDPHAGKLVSELFPKNAPRLFTVGRLDRDSEGLIICTNDGDFAQKIAHPSHDIPKTYQVTVSGKINRAVAQRMQSGVKDAGEFLKPTKVAIWERQGQRTCLEIVLNEGKKREIRRLCQANNLKVERLVRVAIGGLALGDIASGEMQPLTADQCQKMLSQNASA